LLPHPGFGQLVDGISIIYDSIVVVAVVRQSSIKVMMDDAPCLGLNRSLPNVSDLEDVVSHQTRDLYFELWCRLT